jgi:lysozyme family protein
MRREYQELFDNCNIRTQFAQDVNTLVDRIVAQKARYTAVGTPLGIPWYFIGVVHSLESSLKMTGHLHNGDPLTARTVQVPAGRPKTGTAPFTWEQSADDALKLQRLDQWTDWSIPGLLFKLEGYNGFGYRRRLMPSPYLWSFSVHYDKGKFIADGTFSPTAVSRQCGGGTLWRRMAERGIIQFDRDGMPFAGNNGEVTEDVADFQPLVTFSNTKISDSARELQIALNRVPGIFLKVDGIPGSRTSEAFKKVTGHFLVGDPRG